VQELGLKEFRSVLVDHCKHAFGLCLESHTGWRFVFSGDTQLSENVVAAAAGASLLIHEATFDSGMEDDARAKKHSTITDALEVRGAARRWLCAQPCACDRRHAVPKERSGTVCACRAWQERPLMISGASSVSELD
jgi:hypothetical protein